ncbi:MAG: twin transmembrane helix small protein [Rhodobacteraceae bacterium]|jgi:hypothetical protein|nr:twin transmembrane helix small protein [Paracoccaceae bacterium]MBL4556222.1 twin transmembrane helix small protein [Paracoccaceae bacterium]MBL4558459.1 twin transmembrane helix small protein [Paracoccaceae bacterium]HBG99586.1 twin transmembrane helix small protein [Paracoccaceae bacterium]
MPLADNILLYAVIGVALLVAVILAIGIGGFARGGEFNRKHGNQMMRYRLAAQALAVLLIVIFVLVAGRGG